MNKKVAFKTLGCRLNQFETNSLVTGFTNAGYEIVDFSESADVYIINTCTVTNHSDKKSRQEISKAYGTNEDAVLVVTGCMADNHKEKLENDGRVTYAIENDNKSDILTLVNSHFKGEIISPDVLEKDRFGYESVEVGFHTRSMIKIQDGCANFCTFCIVPFVRGRAISRPPDKILNNIREVIGFGYKEVVLTGVNIGRYDQDGVNFEDLVEKILDLPGDFRVRISSIEPEGFGEKLFRLFDHPKLMPHLHMCIQSGSDKILLKMRRNYTVDEFKSMVSTIKNRIPDFNFTTDLMVGFPEETEEDFQLSCDAIKDIGFNHVHTFKYSRRKGTRADRLSDQIPEKIKTSRSSIIRELAEEQKRKYRTSLIGKTQKVLVEKIDTDGFARGYGEYYVPVKFKTKTNTKIKDFSSITITGIEKGEDPDLIGEVTE